MRVFDRLSGRHLTELPSDLLPNRYVLLESFELNGLCFLKPADLLSDDGSCQIWINDVAHKVLLPEHTDEEQEASNLSAEAVVWISEKLGHANQFNVSPMLPAAMAEQCELEELEISLETVIRANHLSSISKRPRIDLRYDDLVVPVMRARRMASSALSHLASHSDCWQQRTLSGVLPRKVLARFSEDEYSIYENRLYKRILDSLELHLVKRLARIQGVNSLLKKAKELEVSEQTHFRLRRDICKLWGEAYQQQNTEKQLREGQRTQDILESQLRAIRGFKQRGLYKLLNEFGSIPAQLHRTNILNHDPHYRYLPILWEGLKNQRDRRPLTPIERFERNQSLQLAYEKYVGLVLRRALERYRSMSSDSKNSYSWAGKEILVKLDSHDWIVTYAGEELRFIPIVWSGQSITDEEMLGEGHVVCWLGTDTSVVSRQRIPISPLDLYVVEKMGRWIDEWLLRQILEGFGQKLGPLPTVIKKITEEWPNQIASISSTHVQLLSPLDDQQINEFRSSLQSSANSELTLLIETAIDQVAVLRRLCGHNANFIASSPEEFYCYCEDCQITWELKTVLNKRVFSFRRKNPLATPPENGFRWSGRDWLEFTLDC